MIKAKNKLLSIYNDDFYGRQKEGSLKSAEIIVPYVMELCKVNNVVDLGCGTGTWLSVFQKHGVKEYLGIDCDHVDSEHLIIPKIFFEAHDLTTPVQTIRRFDLAVCLEVAEHIDENYSEVLINSICGLSDLCLFSAATPFQGGAGHVNEQWPDYWAEKFLRRNYQVFDVIRDKIWSNSKVQWWYAQNILLFANEKGRSNNRLLERPRFHLSPKLLNKIHPTKYLQDVDPDNISVRRATKYLSRALRRKFLGSSN